MADNVRFCRNRQNLSRRLRKLTFRYQCRMTTSDIGIAKVLMFPTLHAQPERHDAGRCCRTRELVNLCPESKVLARLSHQK